MSVLYKLIAIGVAVMLPLIVSAESLVPKPPEAAKKYNEKTQCVRPIADMRRNHMKYLLHERDETMHEGIRTKQFSLKECIDCHNAPGKDGKVASIEDKNHDHFCSTCHNYAAVRIDCFDCHSDKPANTKYRDAVADEKMPGQSIAKQQGDDAKASEELAAKEDRQ